MFPQVPGPSEKTTSPAQLPLGAPQLHVEQLRVSEKLAYRTKRLEYELPVGQATFPEAYMQTCESNGADGRGAHT